LGLRVFYLFYFFNFILFFFIGETQFRKRFETDKWTLRETIELIDSLEKYGENWDEIINVNTKKYYKHLFINLFIFYKRTFPKKDQNMNAFST